MWESVCEQDWGEMVSNWVCYEVAGERFASAALPRRGDASPQVVPFVITASRLWSLVSILKAESALPEASYLTDW